MKVRTVGIGGGDPGRARPCALQVEVGLPLVPYGLISHGELTARASYSSSFVGTMLPAHSPPFWALGLRYEKAGFSPAAWRFKQRGARLRGPAGAPREPSANSCSNFRDVGSEPVGRRFGLRFIRSLRGCLRNCYVEVFATRLVMCKLSVEIPGRWWLPKLSLSSAWQTPSCTIRAEGECLQPVAPPRRLHQGTCSAR